MNEVDKALRYIFILSFLLILVAYYAGAQRIGSTFGTQISNLINVATGRNTQGQFAAYPTGGPPPM